MSFKSMLPQASAPSTWLPSVGLALLGIVAAWCILGSNSLAAATMTSVTVLQTSPPISVSGSSFGLGIAGDTQTYTHTVTNNGLLPQTIALTVTSHRGWSVSVTPSSLVLNGGASGTAVVKITPPSDALSGTLEVTTLSATVGPTKVYNKDSLLIKTGQALAIPALELGRLINGQRVYDLRARSANTEFRPGIQTPTWGYNNNTYLGPTLVMTKTEQVQMHVTNALTEATTVHWHGLHLPGKTDGGPHQEIAVGETWSPSFKIINEAETGWYHPHPHGHGDSMAETALQVYRGLAGMIIVHDANSATLNIPQSYGVDDFPVVVQDRKFSVDGSFDESKDDVGIRNGDTFFVNGTLAGTLDTPAQMVRLRFLNGANHRFLNLGFSDNRSFYQIASDNGLLNAPVQRSRFSMGPGERIEIVVNLSGAQGKTIHVVAYDSELGDTLVPEYIADDFDRSNFVLFSLNITVPTSNPVTSLPSTLNNIARYSANDTSGMRNLRLTLPPAINNKTFDMEIVNITSTLNTQEVWSIINQSNDPHPFHIHDSPFQIIRHLDVSGKDIPIADYEKGWKDTVIVRAGERVDVVKDFSGYADPAGPFMYHCHILEHEGEGMMGQFIIEDRRTVYVPLVRR